MKFGCNFLKNAQFNSQYENRTQRLIEALELLGNYSKMLGISKNEKNNSIYSVSFFISKKVCALHLVQRQIKWNVSSVFTA